MPDQGRQLAASLLTQFAGRVLGKRDQEQVADTANHPIHQQARD